MSQTKPFLSIIIPTFNEECRIAQSLTVIQSFVKTQKYQIEVIIVDDGSSDQTENLVKNFCLKHSDFKFVKNSHLGKALTVKRGVEETTGKYILFSDADLSTPIETINPMLEDLIHQNFEVVIASREAKNAIRINEPYSRHILGRIFNFAIKLFFLPKIQDTQCGFKMFEGKVAKKIFNNLLVFKARGKPAKTAYTGAFDVEILLLSKKYGYRIKEIPVTWTYSNISKVNPINELRYLFHDIFWLLINKIQGKYH